MRMNINGKRNKLFCSTTNKKLAYILVLVSLLVIFTLGCGTSEPTSEIPAGTVTTPGTVSEPTTIPEPVQEPQSEPQPEPEPTEDPTPITKEKETPTPTPTPAPAPDNNSALETTASKLVWSGTSSSAKKQIALTFDSGWEYDQTLQLLEVLDQYQVKATFFLRGGWVKDHPNLAKEIYSRGHSIGNHSLEHGHMKTMSQDEVTADIIESTNIIKNTVGYNPYLFRPPYGEYNNTLLNVLGEQGYLYTVMWTIDTHDWAKTMNGFQVTEQYLIDRVLNNATDNGIVLMHVGGYRTINALPEIITGLREAGYEIVKLDELLPE